MVRSQSSDGARRWRVVAVAVAASLALHALAGLALAALWREPEPAPQPVVLDTLTVEEVPLVLYDPPPRRPTAISPIPPVPTPALPPTIPPALTPGVSPGPPGTPPAGAAKAGPPLAVPTAAGLPPLAPTVRNVVYVLDRSGSMGQFGRLDRARRLLLGQLAGRPEGRFQVLAYHSRATWLTPTWQANTPADRAEAASALAQLAAEGSSAHVEALRLALAQRPHAVVWLTDAGDLSAADARRVLGMLAAARVRLYAVAFPADDRPITNAAADLARASGGYCLWLPPGVD